MYKLVDLILKTIGKFTNKKTTTIKTVIPGISLVLTSIKTIQAKVIYQ